MNSILYYDTPWKSWVRWWFQSMDYLGLNFWSVKSFWIPTVSVGMGCSYVNSMCRQCPFTQSVDEGCLASLVAHSAGRKMWAGGPKIQNYNSNLFGSMSSIHGARKNLMHDMKQGRAWSLVEAAADTEAIEENYCSVHADFKKSIEVLALVHQIWLLMSVSQNILAQHATSKIILFVVIPRGNHH